MGEVHCTIKGANVSCPAYTRTQTPHVLFVCGHQRRNTAAKAVTSKCKYINMHTHTHTPRHTHKHTHVILFEIRIRALFLSTEMFEGFAVSYLCDFVALQQVFSSN